MIVITSVHAIQLTLMKDPMKETKASYFMIFIRDS